MTLAQALILRGSHVLLGRWKAGAFAGRISGLLGDYPAALPRAAAVQACSDLANLCLDPRLLSCRADFKFCEQDASAAAAKELGTTYREYQFVYDVDIVEALRINHPDLDVPGLGEPRETEYFKPIWYHINDIPFSEMPQDDVLWYRRVIVDGEKLTGTFTFDGEMLISHSLGAIEENCSITPNEMSTHDSSSKLLKALTVEQSRLKSCPRGTSNSEFRDFVLKDILKALQ